MNARLPRCSRIQREPHFDGDLPVFHCGLFDVTANLSHFEPAQAMKRFTGAFERVVNRLLNRLRGRAGELDDFVNVIVHNASKIRPSLRPANFAVLKPFKTLSAAGAQVERVGFRPG